jgi:hypothetical protein
LSLEVAGDIAKLMGRPKGYELAVADFVALVRALRRAPGMLEEMDELADPVGLSSLTTMLVRGKEVVAFLWRFSSCF